MRCLRSRRSGWGREQGICISLPRSSTQPSRIAKSSKLKEFQSSEVWPEESSGRAKGKDRKATDGRSWAFQGFGCEMRQATHRGWVKDRERDVSGQDLSRNSA